jgi:hypothetical protein
MTPMTLSTKNRGTAAMSVTLALLTQVVLVVLVALSGCGAEVAGGSAAVGALQAGQVERGRAQQAEVVDKLKAAQEAGVSRAASAAD